MASYADDLKKALDELSKVKAEIEDIRKCKDELQVLKEQLYDTAKSGYYLRDDSRVIISAPEIIIGDVDHTGHLFGNGGSTVVIRGNEVSLQGTGAPGIGGSVTTKASTIRQIAVDPGKDGLENVVWSVSSIVNQAVSISLRSEDSSDTFVYEASSGMPGVSITSETILSLEATPSAKNKKDAIESEVKLLEESSKNAKAMADSCKSELEDTLSYLSGGAQEGESLNDTAVNAITNCSDLRDMRSTFLFADTGLCGTLEQYYDALSRKAEYERRKEDLNKIKDELSKKSSDFAEKTTGACVLMNAETFSFSSVDGDGNVRENAEAGFFVQAPHVGITADDRKGALIKDSSMDINVQKFGLSTANAKYDDDTRTKGTFTSEGDVTITSKTVTLQAIDAELKDGKITEKALTKESAFSLRAENIAATAADTEGKSTGEIKLNAKNIQIASMDLDKEKRTDKEMAKSSQMVLLSEKMFEGSLDKNNKSKLVQVVSDRVAVIGDTTAEMQQGDGKSVVTLDGGSLTAGGSKVELDGDTTISGKADIKGDVEAPNGKFKGVEASGKFKSASISDGMMGGTAAAAGKPSAKMKMEEAQKK